MARTCTAVGLLDQKPFPERSPLIIGEQCMTGTLVPDCIKSTIASMMKMMSMVNSRYSEIKDYTFGEEPRGGPATGF